MRTMANIMLTGKILEKDNNLFLNAITIFNEKLEILLLENKRDNLNKKDLKLVLNKNYSVILKNIIETKNGKLLTIFNEDNYEILNKDLLLFNLKIKVIKNGRYSSATIKDLYNEEIQNLDLSFSLNKETNNEYIENIFKSFESDKNIFNLGVQELNFIKTLVEEDNKVVLDLEIFRKIAKDNNYFYLLKEYFPNLKEKYSKKAKLIDDFIYYKKELQNNNFEVIEDILNILKHKQYKDLPIFINMKIKSAIEDKEKLIEFIKKEYFKIKSYYKIFHRDFDDNIEKEIYLNDIILSSNIKNKNNLNNLKIVNNDRLLLNNVSKFGLTSNILEQLNNGDSK